LNGPSRNSDNGRLYCVYLLRCADDTFYCGIALDPHRRLIQHNDGKGSRYTASRRPVVLEFATECRFTRAEAQVLEVETKRQSRCAKRSYLEMAEMKLLEKKTSRP